VVRFRTVTPWSRPPAETWQVAPGTEAERAAPSRAANLASDLLVPLGQALVTGGLLAGLAVFLLGELAPGWDVNRWKVWAALALGISAVAWLLLLGQTRRLLWSLERVTGLDLDRDGQAGEPAERVIILNAGQGQAEAARRENAERTSRFVDFVRRLPLRGTTQRFWESEIGRDLYCEYRDALIRLGWAKWNSTNGHGEPNVTRGWTLTMDPAEILKRIE